MLATACRFWIWDVDWEAVGAIATAIAVAVALAVPYVQTRREHKASERRARIRTQVVAPEVAADVLEFHHQLGTAIRAIYACLKESGAARSLQFKRSWDEGHLTLGPRVADKINPGDIELVVESVRLRLWTGQPFVDIRLP